jgi:hypothetical protein
MSGFCNSPRYFNVLNDVPIAFSDKKIRNSDNGAFVTSKTKGQVEDWLVDNRHRGVNRLQCAPLPFFERAIAEVRRVAERSKARFLVPLAKAADHFLKGTGLRSLHSVMVQVGTQIAFGWPIS